MGEKHVATDQALIACTFSSDSPTERARRLAVLREDEAAAARIARAELSELAQLRRELALRAAIEREACNRVVEAVGDAREHGPPVAGRSGRGPGRGHRIAVAEQHL